MSFLRQLARQEDSKIHFMSAVCLAIPFEPVVFSRAVKLPEAAYLTAGEEPKGGNPGQASHDIGSLSEEF